MSLRKPSPRCYDHDGWLEAATSTIEAVLKMAAEPVPDWAKNLDSTEGNENVDPEDLLFNPKSLDRIVRKTISSDPRNKADHGIPSARRRGQRGS